VFWVPQIKCRFALAGTSSGKAVIPEQDREEVTVGTKRTQVVWTCGSVNGRRDLFVTPCGAHICGDKVCLLLFTGFTVKVSFDSPAPSSHPAEVRHTDISWR
jgi:hypothetical protein